VVLLRAAPLLQQGLVTRYRIHLEDRHLAPGTINGRLAYEAADAGLLSPELAASIRREKGDRKLGVRLGKLPHTTFDGHARNYVTQRAES